MTSGVLSARRVLILASEHGVEAAGERPAPCGERVQVVGGLAEDDAVRASRTDPATVTTRWPSSADPRERLGVEHEFRGYVSCPADDIQSRWETKSEQAAPTATSCASSAGESTAELKRRTSRKRSLRALPKTWREHRRQHHRPWVGCTRSRDDDSRMRPGGGSCPRFRLSLSKKRSRPTPIRMELRSVRLYKPRFAGSESRSGGSCSCG